MIRDKEDTLYRIAVSMTPGISAEVVRRMEEVGLSPYDFIESGMHELSSALNPGGIGVRFEKLAREEALSRARKELDFTERHGIRVYYLGDDDYPDRLGVIPDAPIVLYQLGATDMDAEHIMNIVGTRRNTAYAATFCEGFIKELSGYFPDAVIVSGLAYGVDSLAHIGALQNGLNTIAVVAHGLDTIYPAAHRDLARRILKTGGSIISEYPSGTTPFRRRFLERNRIVAALSDVTMIVESPIKGGAMSTANQAFSYSRDVIAVPGRVFDPMSEGCNHLIRTNKATLVMNVADLIEVSGWRPAGIAVKPRQRNLFPELEGEAKEIYELLRFSSDPVSVDHICQKTGIRIATLNPILTELEFDGIVTRYPGNRYSL
ncbi:MAG: DNA-processing protein DprA [Muribaculaceae bacterium]|nr:DNA-processing protein DprA [Muribaculaceae bacterium]